MVLKTKQVFCSCLIWYKRVRLFIDSRQVLRSNWSTISGKIKLTQLLRTYSKALTWYEHSDFTRAHLTSELALMSALNKLRSNHKRSACLLIKSVRAHFYFTHYLRILISFIEGTIKSQCF